MKSSGSSVVSSKRPPKRGSLVALAAVGAMLVLGGIGYAMYTMLLSPSAQAAKTSASFMAAFARGDTKTAVSLTAAKTEDEKAVEAAKGAKIQGKTYTLVENAFVNDKGYFLYHVAGSNKQQYKYARSIVEERKGAWLVTSFIVADQQMTLMPNETPGSTFSSSDTSRSVCLVASDYDDIYMELYGTARPTSAAFGPGSPALAKNVTLTTDSTALDSSSKDTFTAFVSFYKATPTKDFSFFISGVAVTPSAADLEAVEGRAQTVADLLEAAGVDQDRTMVQPPTSVTGMPGASNQARDVTITITPSTTCKKS